MRSFVISLKSAVDRRLHIQEQFACKDIPFPILMRLNRKEIDELAQKYSISILDSGLSKGELGCLFSHVLLWKKAIDEQMDYIAVFEDDIYLGERANDFLIE